MPGFGVFAMPSRGPRQRIRTRVERERENAANLGDIYKFTRDPVLAEQRAKARRERANSTPKGRMVICSIRGCKAGLFGEWSEIAVCIDHAIILWEKVEAFDASPYIREQLAESVARRDAMRAANRAADEAEARQHLHSPEAMGAIYYAKVGDLIKVGWTSNLYDRMRSYGPEAELLVRYPATRSDETHLHRNLKPSRAKGREWYHDDPIIQAFVTLALRQYGPPPFTQIEWTKPKQVVAGKRASRPA